MKLLIQTKCIHKQRKIIANPDRKLLAKFGVVLGGIVSVIASAIPACGAERISFYYAPFGQFDLPIDSLETFAKKGKIDSDFAYYAKFANPEELASLRDLLQRRFDVTPTLVSQFIPFHFKVDTFRQAGEAGEAREAGGVNCIRIFVKWYYLLSGRRNSNEAVGK